MYGTPQRRSGNFAFAADIPATAFLIAANVVTFLAAFFAADWSSDRLFWWLKFTSVTWPQFFWTLITWPLVAEVNLIGLLFGGLWAYWIGGLLLGRPVHAQGLWLAIAAPTIAWCVLNKREVIRLYAIIPIPAPILAWLTVAITWFSVSMSGNHPLLGLFALSGCAAAYGYATHGRYAYRGYAGTSGPLGGLRGGGGGRSGGGSPPLRFRDFDREPEPVHRGFDPIGRLRAWRQRRQLEKLFKRSGFSDPDEKNRRS